MTVTGLHQKIIQRSRLDQNDGVNKHRITFLLRPGLGFVRVGLDVSIWLHQAMSTQRAADEYHTRPKIPIDAALQYFKERLRILDICGAKPVLVYDGFNNPIKADTHNARLGRKTEPEAELGELLEAGRPHTFDRVKKLRKQTAQIRHDLLADIIRHCQQNRIPCIQAPCEAEQQLVQLEKEKHIDAILSEDGDALIAGGSTVVGLVKWNQSEPSETSCCIYFADAVWQRESAGAGRWITYLPELSSFCGNDYVGNLAGVGPQKAGQLLDKYIAMQSEHERVAFLQELEAKSYWSKGFRTNKQRATGFVAKWQRSTMFNRHGPVFSFNPAKQGAAVDLSDPDSFEVSLSPLNPFPPGVGYSNCGFKDDQEPHLFLDNMLPPGRQDYRTLAVMAEVDLRSGKRLKCLELPRLSHPPHYQVAHGSYLDFNVCPIDLQPERALSWYLFVRTLCPKGKVKRPVLVRLVKDVVALEKRCPRSTSVPRRYEQLKMSNSASYQVSESLKARNEQVGLVWNSNPANVVAKIRAFQPLSDEVVNDFFGEGRNGVRFRACCRLKGGNYDVATLAHALVKAEVRGETVDAVAIRIKTTPSMKSNDYWTTLVFEDREGGTLLGAPNSRCECPCGTLCCSHELGEIAVLDIIQEFDSLTLEQIARLLPQPIKSVTSIPIPWSFAFERDRSTRKRTITYTRAPKKTPAPKRARRVVLNQEESPRGVLDLNLEAQEDSDGSDSDFIPDGSDSNLTDDSDFISDDDSEGSDSDFTVDSDFFFDEEDDEEVLLSDCSLSSTIDSDVDSVLNDEDEEDLAQNETDGSNETKYLICETARNMVVSAINSNGGNIPSDGPSDESTGYKVTMENIERANQDLLDGKGGPNENAESKREQLEFHERLHHLYEAGELPKSPMSHYLLATAGSRTRWLAQLVDCSDSEEQIIMPPVRLEKIPPWIKVLADRGFAACAPMYPNLNPQITPFFLDGRDQFTMEEISLDREKCKLRWASEAVFSKVWMVSSVRDKVGRGFFEQLHHFVELAHGLANLADRYYTPAHDNYFSDEWSLGTPLPVENFQNYIDYAVPQKYIDAGMKDTGVLKDGKDFVTDTVRVNPALTRALFSDKVKSSGARIITWALPTGLVFEHTSLYLGRTPEIRLVELWGRRRASTN